MIKNLPKGFSTRQHKGTGQLSPDFIDRFQQPRPQFLAEGKRPLHHDPGNLTILHALDLGATLFPGPKWVRAKDAKDAKG